MTPNINFSLTENRPKQLTSSLVTPEVVDVNALSYFSANTIKYCIPVVKHERDGKVFFFWDVDKYISLVELLQNGANENSLDQFIQSFVRSLRELESQNVNIDSINLFPQYIFLDPQSYEARFVITPVKDSTPTNLRAFFDEFRAVVPFSPTQDSKLFALFKYLDLTSMFSLRSLYSAMFQGEEPTHNGMQPAQNVQLTPVQNASTPNEFATISTPDTGLPPAATPAFVAPPNVTSPTLNQPSSEFPQQLSNLNVAPLPPASVASDNTPQVYGGAQNTQVLAPTLIDALTKREIRISRTPFTIGRHPQLADFLLESPYISAEHARINRNELGQYTITDLNSVNGTFVNFVRVVSSDSDTLNSGDVIKLADSDFIFQTH